MYMRKFNRPDNKNYIAPFMYVSLIQIAAFHAKIHILRKRRYAMLISNNDELKNNITSFNYSCAFNLHYSVLLAII